MPARKARIGLGVTERSRSLRIRPRPVVGYCVIATTTPVVNQRPLRTHAARGLWVGGLQCNVRVRVWFLARGGCAGCARAAKPDHDGGSPRWQRAEVASSNGAAIAVRWGK